MNPRVKRILENLELGADGVYSAVMPQNTQLEEIVLRETVAAQKHADHLRVISQHHSIEVMDAEVRRFLAGIPPDGVIVDVGGGWGWHWRNLRELRSNASILVVDFARTNFRQAHQILGDMVNDQVFLVHGDATSLPFDNATVDGFWSVQALQHIPDFETAVSEAWRVLRPGGKFANYSLNSPRLVRAAYRILGKRYHLAGQVKGFYYLERASRRQLDIVSHVFGNDPRVRFTEILFQPALSLTRTGSKASRLGRLDALLGSGLWPASLIARQRSYHAYVVDVCLPRQRLLQLPVRRGAIMVANVRRATNYMVRKGFPYFEKYFGIHITPADYHSPIPTTYQLEPELFLKPFSCAGLNWNEDRQLATMKNAAKYNSESTPLQNSGLSLLDAQILYAMIRERKPKLMIEIGSGESTKIALQALRRNREEGHGFRFFAIEPYPSAALLDLKDPDFELMVTKVQDVDLAFFAQTDLLFIDSTHVSRIGSDVNYEIFEILPSLRVGTFIHWHDIPLPMNYWQDWIKSGNQFWNESYVLHAFLMYNRNFDICWASSYMRLRHFAALKALFPFLTEKHQISSFWVEKAVL